MRDENPIRTLGYYSKPSHEGYRNTIELPVGNNVCEINRAAGGKLRNKNINESWEIIENLALYDHEGWDETNEFRQRSRHCLTYGSNKHLTVEALFPITKNVNSISLAKGEEEKSNERKVTPDNTEKPTETGMKMSVKEVETKDEAENRAENESIKTPESEEVVEVTGSQLVAYYLKHRINEKLIKGLVNNNRFNNSLSGTRVRKKKKKAYNVLPRGPVYESDL
ncbi:hypothetical protein Tco_0051468 [Tanacetum coccineum]